MNFSRAPNSLTGSGTSFRRSCAGLLVQGREPFSSLIYTNYLIISDVLSDIDSDIQSAINSDILSAINFDILSEINRDGLSGINSDSLSDIDSDIPFEI